MDICLPVNFLRFIHGNSVESTLLAVVVPDIPAAKAWAAENAPDTKDMAAIAPLPEFKKAVLAQLVEAADEANLKGYEKIKSEHQLLLEAENLNELGQAWHTGNELMTPSFKLKRPQLARKYGEQFVTMYASMK
jgi:long-chain acyl-CoA synthetase